MSSERTEADAPADNRWSHLIEHIHDAVVEFELVGNEPIVRSVNQSFVDDYGYAAVTALIGAIVWAVVSFFLGWIPLLGPLATLLAYVGVIERRYPGGWVDAALVAFEAVGVPGI
ncbi:MAG: hypothetical protein ABEH56_01275 [Salinirussus sp.]